MTSNSHSATHFRRFPDTVALKRGLQYRLAREFRGVLPGALVQRAIDEAEQIAASTGFPHCSSLRSRESKSAASHWPYRMGAALTTATLGIAQHKFSWAIWKPTSISHPPKIPL